MARLLRCRPSGVLYLLILFISLAIPTESTPIARETAPDVARPETIYSHDLANQMVGNGVARRQCSLNQAGTAYGCDIFFPSLEEIINNMHNAELGGIADSSHSLIFYTGLDISQDQMCNVIERCEFNIPGKAVMDARTSLSFSPRTCRSSELSLTHLDVSLQGLVHKSLPTVGIRIATILYGSNSKTTMARPSCTRTKFSRFMVKILSETG
jgi:hypothetical protein